MFGLLSRRLVAVRRTEILFWLVVILVVSLALLAWLFTETPRRATTDRAGFTSSTLIPPLAGTGPARPFALR